MCNYQSNLIFKPYFAQVSHLRTSSGQNHFTARRCTTATKTYLDNRCTATKTYFYNRDFLTTRWCTATKTYLDSRVFLATRTCSTIKAFLLASQELNNQSITFPLKQVEHLSNIKN